MIDRHQSLRTALLALIVTVTFTAPLFAQIPGLGVKGGINLASQDTSGDAAGDDGLKTSAGLVAGVFMTLPIASWLEFQPEVLYSVKGARVSESGFSGSLLIDYLEVPLLARISRRGSGRTGFYAAGGAYAALKMRARTRITFGGSTEEMDIGEDVETADFGLAIGGGLEFGSLVFDGRYSHGLKDIDKDRTDGVKVLNRAIAITAGFRF